MSTVITSVDHRSPAQRAGIRPGEKLLTINGHEIVDVLDYRFYGYDAKCRLELLEPNGSVRNVQIKKGRWPGSWAEFRHLSDGRNALLRQPLCVLLRGPDAPRNAPDPLF